VNVGELIAYLEGQPRDLRVVINGYEGGYRDVDAARIRTIRIRPNVGGPDYYGEHARPNDYRALDNPGPLESALLFDRYDEDYGDEDIE
jgi:hypothetical protein